MSSSSSPRRTTRDTSREKSRETSHTSTRRTTRDKEREREERKETNNKETVSGNSSTGSERGVNLLKIWQGLAILAVSLPIGFCALVTIFTRDGWGWDYDEGEGVHYFVALTAYIFSLLVFLAMVTNGNVYIKDGTQKKKTKKKSWFFWRSVSNESRKLSKLLGLLTGALVIFGCFSLLLLVVTTVLLVDFEDGDVFLQSLGKPIMFVPFAFLLWTLFCCGFAAEFHGSIETDVLGLLKDSKTQPLV